VRDKWRESYTRDKASTTWARLHRTREAFTYRAMCYYARQDSVDKIFRVLDMALEADSHFVPALYLKANILTEHGRYEEAVPLFNRLLEVWELTRVGRSSSASSASSPSPSTSSASSSGGDVTASSTSDGAPPAAAFEAHDLVFRSYPIYGDKAMEVRVPEVWNNLGKCQYELGRFPDALHSFQQSVQLGGHSWLTSFNLARVNLDMGNLDLARIHGVATMVALWNGYYYYHDIITILTWRLQLWTALQNPLNAEIDQAVLSYFEAHRDVPDSNADPERHTAITQIFSRWSRDELESLGYSIDY
jgi:tetratricopeptide (TPR) repeat protein